MAKFPESATSTTIIISMVTSVLTSILTGWINPKIAVFKERRDSLRKEACGRIKDLQASTQDIADQVQHHLLGKPNADDNQTASQKKIDVGMKLLHSKIKTLQVYLEKAPGDELESKFLAWKIVLTGDSGYPIKRKNQALVAHDPRLTLISAEQTKLNLHLEKVLCSCLTHDLKILNPSRRSQ